jgi:hypothetical protein
MTGGWERVDSWVLMGLTREAQPLEEVIARMDALNHLIPAQEDLAVSLGWLVGAGLVAVDGANYLLTQQGSDLVESTSASTRGWLAAWDRVDAALKEQPRPQSPAQVDLPQSEYERALRAYKALWKEYRKQHP